jgi:predicted membrane chloride channel (bestrophin family)
LNWVQSYVATAEGIDAAAGQAITDFVKSLTIAKLPLQPFTLSSPALGLLLVFRTNGAFQRFFEARALWGALINYSRNCVRQVRATETDSLCLIKPEA